MTSAKILSCFCDMEQPHRKDHWDRVYRTIPLSEVSWYKPVPETSLRMIDELSIDKNAAIIDVGGGNSLLVDHLLAKRYTNITVLDIFQESINRLKERFSEKAALVKFIASDMMRLNQAEKYDVWHDRAEFHFLTVAGDQTKYLETAHRHLKAKGWLLLSSFSMEGPEKCSGLAISRYDELILPALFNLYFNKVKCVTKDHLTTFQNLQRFIYCIFEHK